MGAGGKPVNIFTFKKNGNEPPEVLNWKLWFAVLSFGIMGAARGIDEGLISGTFATKHFQHALGLNKLDTVDLAQVKANVSAMVQIGSVGGALLAFVLADRIGRLWATRQLCLVWILGIVIFMTSTVGGGRLGQVYAGRFIAGLGIGQTTVIAPVYISEIAPKSVRGLCTCVFSGSVYIGIMLAYFASWGSSLHISKTSPNSWEVPTSIHLMFAGIIFILSFFNYESPRYLIKAGNREHAVANLARVRGLPIDHEVVQGEIADIEHQLHEEQEATLGQGAVGYIKEMFFMPNNAYRLYIGLGSQLCIFALNDAVAAEYLLIFLSVSVVGRTKHNNLRSRLFRSPWHQRPEREAVRHCHLRCCQVRRCYCLCSLLGRLDRSQAFPQHRYRLPGHLYGLRCCLPYRCSWH
jgi:MFS family permease